MRAARFSAQQDGMLRAVATYCCDHCAAQGPKGPCQTCGHGEVVRFDSRGEAGRWRELVGWARCKGITDLDRQVPFRVCINGLHYCTYVADFVYTAYGSKGPYRVVEDYKGSRKHEDRASKLRRKAAELYHAMTVTLVGGK